MSDFSFIGTLQKILMESGFAAFAEDPRSLIMIIVACVLFYMGIGKKIRASFTCTNRFWYFAF